MKTHLVGGSLFFLILLVSLNTAAQHVNESYKGFKVTFGTHALKVRSDVPELNQLPAKFDGGSIGVVKGNKFVRAGLTVAGFYYSTDNVPRTIDLVYSDATIHFYPLAFSKKDFPIQPYLASGLALSRLKFYGHYLPQEPSKPINYSAPEPYIGKQRTISAMFQVGLEYRFPSYEFLTVFTECTLLRPLASSADAMFEKTSVHKIASLQVGVAFGSLKK
ncbi:MAG TPA: hypothetical protein VGD65_07775 [Chryseosolibacter sp.]